MFIEVFIVSFLARNDIVVFYILCLRREVVFSVRSSDFLSVWQRCLHIDWVVVF